MKRFVFVFSSLLAAFATSAHAADKRIKNFASMPQISQKQNFETLLGTTPTRMKWSDGKAVKTSQYDTVYKDHVIRYNSKLNFYFVAKETDPAGADVREANISDVAEIEAGSYHCAPAAAAMMLQYYGEDLGFDKLKIGTTATKAYIHGISIKMDTNGIAAAPPLGDTDPRKTQAFLGTRTALVVGAIKSVMKEAKATYGGSGEFKAFDLAAYKKAIDADRPVYLSMRKENQALSHAVVGIGYTEDDKIIVRDPWEDGTEQIIAKPLGGIPFAPKEEGGLRYNSYGDVSITKPEFFSPDYADMLDFTPVPEPASMIALGIGAVALMRRRKPR
ncbi:MAG: C39 family peptidase [Fimbriimonas sp.]